MTPGGHRRLHVPSRRRDDHELFSQELQQLANGLRGAVAHSWPNFEPPAGVCALLELTDRRHARIYFNPDHKCTNPDSVFMKAAVLVNTCRYDGPDEGWWQHDELGVLCTYITERSTVGDLKGVAIPVSEMPPLD